MSCCIDFPQTTCSTDLAVAFKKFTLHSWYEKSRVHNIFIQMLLCILVAAHAVWFFERLSNPNFPRRYLAGIDDAMWFSAVTVTTVGYGDKCPKTTGGRYVTLLWMLMGIVISSLFTAVVTSEVSSNNEASDVRTLADFVGKRVCTTDGYWQTDPQISKYRAYFGKEVIGTSLADCIDRMIGDHNTVDAVYYDRPPMQKMLLDRRVASAVVMTPAIAPLQLTPIFPDAFNPRFGPPVVKELRNEYNEQVLALAVSGKLDVIYNHFFAEHGKGLGTMEETLDVKGLIVLVNSISRARALASTVHVSYTSLAC